MRFISVLALIFTATLPELGLPKDPRAIFAAAAPFYDFTSPELKPWHMKATYQLYDEKGKPSEQGTYEYWWASPKIYRSTWTRPGLTHSDWHTANGQHEYLNTGERLKFFEYQLQDELLTPLPDSGDLDPAKVRLDRESLSPGETKLPCVMVIPLMPQHGQLQSVPLGMFPTYCFDPQMPILRINYSFGTLATEFNHIVKVQNRYLAREILLFEGKREILSANVDALTALAPSDPALMPPDSATVDKIGPVSVASGIAAGWLLRKTVPVYPLDAKEARVSGKVVLEATIGTDGAIHQLHVVSAPWPSLAASALWAVSHWEYKPYLLNGQPVEVETTINVIYTLGD
jgi:TonB family protein